MTPLENLKGRLFEVNKALEEEDEKVRKAEDNIKLIKKQSKNTRLEKKQLEEAIEILGKEQKDG